MFLFSSSIVVLRLSDFFAANFLFFLLVTVSDGLESSFTGLKKKKKKPVSWSAL